jgi:hypothetical protein
MSEFSANASAIKESSKELKTLQLLGRKMADKFWEGTTYYKDWPGVEGGDDAFANALIPQLKKITESLGMAVESVDQVVNGVVEALGGEAVAVRKPQDAALEDIQQQGGVRR